jgi:hypothetical protein
MKITSSSSTSPSMLGSTFECGSNSCHLTASTFGPSSNGSSFGTYRGRTCALETLGISRAASRSLWDYIQWFSKQCNSLPDIVDADIVSTFISETTFKSLVHKLSWRKPRTTRELLDIAMNHASG